MNDSTQNQENTRELAKEVHWTQHATLGTQIILGLIGLAALWIYHSQLCTMQGQLNQMSTQSTEIQKQTNLMRNQIIGTQGAILQFEPHLSVTGLMGGESPVFINGVKVSPGRVTARNVVIELTVQRISLPSKKSIGSPIRCDIRLPQLASNTGDVRVEGIPKVCGLPGFDQTAADEVMFTRQSVNIKGFLEYGNGFDQLIHQDICKTFLGYKFKGEEKGQSGTANPVGGEDESFHDCDDFDRVFRRAMQFKSRYQENYSPAR